MKVPANIRALPKRGRLPIPWFVKDPNDFRVIDDSKWQLALDKKLIV